MFIKLSDMQTALLAAASEHEDRYLTPPTGAKLASARRAAAKLVEAGLVKEVKAKGNAPVWRRDDESGCDQTLKLSAAGLKAITAANAAVDKNIAQSAPSDVPLAIPAAAPLRTEQVANKPSALAGLTVASIRPTVPRAGTKIAEIIGLLTRGGGATIDELVSAMGWLPHTIRAALTGLRKRGYVLFLDRSDRTRGSTYRIEALVALAPSYSSGQDAIGTPTAEDAKPEADATPDSRKRRRATATVGNSAQSHDAP